MLDFLEIILKSNLVLLKAHNSLKKHFCQFGKTYHPIYLKFDTVSLVETVSTEIVENLFQGS